MKVQIVLFCVISAVFAQCDIDVPCNCSDVSDITVSRGGYTLVEGGTTCSPILSCTAPDAYLAFSFETVPTGNLGTFFVAAPNTTATPFDMVSYFGIYCESNGYWYVNKFVGPIYYQVWEGMTAYMHVYNETLATPYWIASIACASFAKDFSNTIFV